MQHAREPSSRLVIAITGSSGLVGSALARSLVASGHTVRPIVRRSPASPNEIGWDPDRGSIDATRLEGAQIVINLAGENIAQRWTGDVKRRIRESRVHGTTLLAKTIISLATKPRALLSGSAIGIYGDRGDELLDETSAPGNDFLASVCKEWEAATMPAADAGIRVVTLRTGIVLAREGGALAKMLMPFRLGVGGRLGSGRQWMSWIALEDYVRATELLISTDTVAGPVNLVGPNPVTNADFARLLGYVLRRPAMMPVPRFVMKLALGNMIDDTVLASQRVRPRRLVDTRFEFNFPTAESALRRALSSGDQGAQPV